MTQGFLFGHGFPSGVHITQYLECSVNFIGALGEVVESVDCVSIDWLPCMGARLVVASATSLAFPRMSAQFY